MAQSIAHIRLACRHRAAPLAVFLTVACGGAANSAVVNIYSTRHYGAMEPMYAGFTAETGIEVRVSHGNMHALLERLRSEG